MMESFSGMSRPIQPVPSLPLTMKSATPRMAKEINAASATAVAFKYDRWKRVPRKPDHFVRFGVIQNMKNVQDPHSFQRKKVLPSKVSECKQMKEKKELMLKIKVAAAYKALTQLKQRERHQLEIRLKLCEEIDRKENDTWINANMMLRKYERLKSGILRIHKNFQKDFDNEQKELFNMKEATESKIKDIEKELNILDSLLQTQNTEYTELLNYKHQQYPMKALIIESLEKDIEDIKATNEMKEKEIEHVISCNMARCRQRWNGEEEYMAKLITKKSFDLMPLSIKQMLVENTIMKKEINFHLKANEELEKQVKSLIDEIKQLSRDPLSNYRLQIFPEFFPKETKCNPDFDIVLDIPHQTFIPI